MTRVDRPDPDGRERGRFRRDRRRRRRFRRDRRAVSVSVTHVLVLGITTLLVGGILVAAGGLVDGQRDRAATEQLEVVGERLVTELERTDQLANETPNATVELRTDHPARIVGSDYRIYLLTDAGVCSARVCLLLNVSDPEVRTTIPVANRTRVDPATVRGGDVVVTYDGTAVTLEPEGSA